MCYAKRLTRALALLGLLGAASMNLWAGIMASSTYTDTQVSPGLFCYDLTLTNTGTTTIGSFWFAWIPGAGFLSSPPSNVMDPAGWTDFVTNGNTAIQWDATGPLLAPGHSASGFQFDSLETPSQLMGTVPSGFGAGDPITTAFVYIAAPLADPGFQLAATQATQAPEPATFGFGVLAIGLGLMRRARVRGR